MQKRGRWLPFLIVAWLPLLAAPQASAEEARYRIEHEMFGKIGEETLTIRFEHDRVLVERRVAVEVRILMASLHYRHARYSEVWQGDRLIRCEGLTDDNGERSTVTAAQTQDAIAIRRAGRTIRAPRDAMPTDPRHIDLVSGRLMFDRVNGHVMEVSVLDLGDERLAIDGQTLDTRKFRLSGQREQELWFDRSTGVWLRSRIEHASGAIMIVREEPSRRLRLAGVTPGSHEERLRHAR